MLDSLLLLLTNPVLVGLMLVAVPVGLFFGIVPGLGGKMAIVSFLPFIFTMDQAAGCVFLIALHAVVHTGGAVPSILFGIPGTGPSTAIVLDGHAMARRGEAVRALAASSVSSALGGLIGAAVLAILIPFALLIFQTISYPEVFLLALFGICISASLGGDSPTTGLITGCFGVVLSTVGTDLFYGVERFTFNQVMLWDGIDLVTAVLAIYALPEMIDLSLSNKKNSTNPLSVQSSMIEIKKGIKDVIVHKWLALRTSMLGVAIGFIPGLGGDAAAWMCYAHAAQSSKQPGRFGKGTIEGIIGPEAANNSKEGGALAPTLFLGLPGSSGMALVLVAFVPLGIDPGPSLATENTQIVWLMVWALALSNVVAAVVIIAGAPAFTKVAILESHYIVPFVYVLAMLSITISSQEPRFLLVGSGLAVIGYLFKKQNWARAPFVIGFILGPGAEASLIKSYGIWGFQFMLRPAYIAAFIIVLFIMLRAVRAHNSASIGDTGKRHE